MGKSCTMKKKQVNQAKISAAEENSFHIHIAIFNFL